MRKSSAEHATHPSSGKHMSGPSIRKGLTQGFRLGASEDNGRASMVGRRSNSRGWEIRLGALQVVVWLGLSLGAIFGSYFIGFFSGRYVGFEAARTATGVEVPKLSITDDIAERPQKGWDNVYGKLGGSAKVEQEESAAAPDKAQAPEKAQVPEQRAARSSQEQKTQDVAKAAESESAVVVRKDPLSDTDAIFTSDVGGGDSLVDDSPSKEISGKGGEVRVLGREVDTVDGGAQAVADSKEATTAKKVSAAKEVEQPASPKPAAEPKVAKEPAKEKISVVKRLPSGYFAQVAAPKTKGEAEEMARKLRKSGFPVVVEDNSTGRSPFYRVMVGPEDNKVQADRLLGQLKREKYIDGKLFVRQVK